MAGSGFETSTEGGDALSTFLTDTCCGQKNHHKNKKLASQNLLGNKTQKEKESTKITVCEFDYTQTLVKEEKMIQSVKKRQVIIEVNQIPDRLAEDNETLL